MAKTKAETKRVAVIQMTSGDVVDTNLQRACAFVAEAAAQGAAFVALPENFAFMRREGTGFPCAQAVEGEILSQVRQWAASQNLWILAGTFPEAIPGDSRVYNSSALIDDRGEIRALYRKIHLFDVDLSASGGDQLTESASVAPGEEPVLAETDFGPVGLSVCYDLRFPELYRELSKRGARWLTVPSAFTPHTGKAHWEILLRARAIENQAFVLAPAQCGSHNPQRHSYGHSMIIDPWGRILAQAGEEPGVFVADCDLHDQEQQRAALPCLQHRRLTEA
ncbi:MAG: carbon-nitrogen hydrolase family protein [Deltaproteobacteria bacterium]|nr:carbon-nitrogen hydrolase family protein [Deltaproteobacteria bacterium]